MRKLLYSCVATAALALGVNAASAADLYTPPPAEVAIAPAPAAVGGWYVGIHGGAAFPLAMKTSVDAVWEDTDVGDAGGFFGNGKTHFDTGWLVGGTVGYEMGNGLRGELEVTYLNAGNKKVKGSWGYDAYDAGDNLIDWDAGNYSIKTKGHLDATFVLANLWYDFNSMGAFKPYVGGGVGVAFVGQNLKAGGFKLLDDSSTAFAFQAGAGVKWALSDAVDLDVGYRFKGALDANLKQNRLWVGQDGEVALATQSKDDLYVHTVQVGLTFKFGGY